MGIDMDNADDMPAHRLGRLWKFKKAGADE